MKKITFIAVAALISLSSCSVENYLGCPTYTGTHKKTSNYGTKRPSSKYAKKYSRKHSLI